MRLYLFAVALVLIAACNTTKQDDITKNKSQKKFQSPESQVLDQAIAAHGGSLYEMAYYKFVFRGKQYSFHNNGQAYKYTVSSVKNGKTIQDVLDNDGVTRTIDDVSQQLTDKQKRSYADAVNSVIYFATLPHKLQDPAVNMKLLKEVSIKGQTYSALQVNFDEEGGGTDHDDNYIYWINKKTHRIDYLAYDYQVNNGGVRFRSAYNARVVDGIVFQDYVNYKAPVGTKLSLLPGLYEEERLQQLSLIETEDVVSLN